MITPIYAALLCLVFIYLAMRVIKFRRGYKVALGDGDEKLLNKAIRAHGNFAEYVPFALLLMLMVELQLDQQSPYLHVLGIALLLGRLLHAYAVSQPTEPLKFRVYGMLLTFTVLIASALWALYLGIF
ncbi:membrane-associated protein [Grimontia sp. S25]|uniref:Membrane-associated protein n=1 Tax=Grimontia sedimenti TaxID=2711294 RepID=A0A6M1RG01_9GAMM|nr:MAPEG family protein [Grimontia sedimenti]NGN97231.1 membrane-associated protein [Grimontia sedimenti]